MAFRKRSTALALLLFVVLLGEAVDSALVRREAPDTTLSAAATEGDATPADAQETDASEGVNITENEATETGGTEKEDEAAGDTEQEGEATGETEKGEDEEEEDSTEEGISDEDEDEDEDQFPDVGFQTGIVFGSPFVTLRQMQQYFFELERALHKVFENTLNEAAQNPDMKNNTTTTNEEVTIGGHKYLVNRTVITGGDEDTAVVIKAISMVPKQDRRKRAVMELW